MNAEEFNELAELVARFVDLREATPDLEPEAFVREQVTDEELGGQLLAALRSALSVEGMFRDASGDAPARIDDYDVIREIGRGGMGVVFEVEQGGRRFALKTLAAAGLAGSNFLARFRRETESLQRLDHSGIVRVHAVGTTDGIPYLVMDLLPGATLADLAGTLRYHRCAELVAEVLDALQVAHDAGIHHRDVKPANVKLHDDGTAVLLDFGLVADPDDVTLTHTGDLLGTPRYMAPEQARGQPTDVRTDVFGAGLLLYELVTGRPLYEGAERTRVLAAAATGKTPRARRLRPDLPRELDRILRVALARDPDRRYQTAAAMAADVRRFMHGAQPTGRPPGFAVLVREWAVANPFPAIGLVFLLAIATWSSAGWLHERSLRQRAITANTQAAAAVDAWLGGRNGEARRLAQTSVETHPTLEGEALRALLGPDGTAYTAIDADLRAAIAAFREDRMDDAFPSLDAARRAHSACDVLHILAGRCALRLKRYAAAIECLRPAANHRPDSGSLALGLADAHRMLGDDPAAKTEYIRALRVGGPSARALEGLAHVQLATDKKSALESARQALDLSGGDNPTVENLIGVILDRMEQRAAAQVIFRKLTAKYPKSVEYAFNLAFSLDSSLAVREAKAGYEMALALEPHHLQANICMVWLLVTAKDDTLRDIERAEQLLVDILKRDRCRSSPVVHITTNFVARTRRFNTVLQTLDVLGQDANTPDATRDTVRRLARSIRSSR